MTATTSHRWAGMAEADPWRCAWCAKSYVVPVLARDCEQHHLEADT